MSRPTAILSTTLPKTSLIPLAIISSRIVKSRLRANRSLLWVSLVALGLAVGTAMPVLAGSGGWNKTGGMNNVRLYTTATLLSNGEVLAAGGGLSAATLGSAEVYNPASGKWTLTGAMTTPRYLHQAVRLQNGQVLVAGGFDANNNITTSAELYSPSAGTWTATGRMNVARESFLLVVLANGKVLAAGGANNGNPPLTSGELYNPATGTWTPTGNMPSGFECDGSATLIPNGQVLAICFGAASLYDPSTGTWAATSQPPPADGGGRMGFCRTARSGTKATSCIPPPTGQWTAFTTPAPCSRCTIGGEVLLASGEVLGAGGEQGTFGYSTFDTIKNAELFDPSTLTWTSTGSMVVSRVGETLTLLSNGQVLAAGGQTFDKGKNMLVTITSAELYTS